MFIQVVAICESCVNLHRAVWVGVRKICNGILRVDHLLPRKIHRKIQHAEFIRNLTSEMLGVAEAGKHVSTRDEEQQHKKMERLVAM